MPEAPTLDLTYSQMPALSERLTPLQRTLAESYQRVFMRGNRTDDLLIFSGLINEIADSQDAKRPALGYVEATKLTEQVGALQASEDELTGKLKDVRELLESLEFDQDKSRAILKEALGEDANIDTRPVYESIVQLFRKSQLEASTANDSSLQDELTLLKDQLAEATKVVEESQHAKQEKYAALHFEFRPKLEQFFGSQAQTQSIEDCFRNLIARHKHSETDISKAREHLISVLGEEQVDAVPMADGVLMLKARYSGACARIKQLEAQVGQLQASAVPQAPVISLQSPSALDTPSAADASNQPCKLLPVETPVAVGVAVVEAPDEPKVEEVKRGPGRPKKVVFVEKMEVSELAKKFYLQGVPVLGDLKRKLPDVAQLAYGDGLTISGISRQLRLGLTEASDVLRVVDRCLEVKKEVGATQEEFMAALEEVSA